MGRLARFFTEQSITLAAQMKTKMLALDREFEQLEAERDTLKTENLKLRAEVNPLKREVERLKERVEKQGAEHRRLDPAAEKMLLDAANGNANKSELIAASGLSAAKAEYYLDVMAQRFFIVPGTTYGMMPEYYEVLSDGRAYLVEHGLI